MKKLRSFINQLMLSIILVLAVLILAKKNVNFKTTLYNQVYNNNISFGYINLLYNKYFGKILPFSIDLNPKPVFNETLKYKEVNKYLDGCNLKVDNNYLVPSIKAGLIVFIGNKEGYGNTVIVEGEDGNEIWYGNIENLSVSLYDYIEKGTFLGSSIDDNLYLVFKQNGESINYEEYLN